MNLPNFFSMILNLNKYAIPGKRTQNLQVEDGKINFQIVKLEKCPKFKNILNRRIIEI